MDHVGIAEDEIRLDASTAATRGIRIAIDQGNAQIPAEAECMQAAGLVLCEGFRGRQIERTGVLLS
ncbi:MAG: hypothetical protein EXQ67_08145 [Thermoleophilia bacterium]|nr:hypothetical protein [Thermoleophilia bacterium]